MFTLFGRLEGKPAELTWDEGEITGTERAVELFNLMQKENDEWVYIDSMGERRNKNASDPLACYILMTRLLYPITKGEGDIPGPPPVPEGTVS